ncbi:hypothetical protein BJF90_13970 [Pseudonocardia sp. CNS-004]|nr:hypothetical protein BJF90_13970 [Pseudonocardia sp. CNS-004]
MLVHVHDELVVEVEPLAAARLVEPQGRDEQHQRVVADHAVARLQSAQLDLQHVVGERHLRAALVGEQLREVRAALQHRRVGAAHQLEEEAAVGQVPHAPGRGLRLQPREHEVAVDARGGGRHAAGLDRRGIRDRPREVQQRRGQAAGLRHPGLRLLVADRGGSPPPRGAAVGHRVHRGRSSCLGRAAQGSLARPFIG